MEKLIVSDTKSFCNRKEKKVLDINASILNRSNRKFWYIKYQVFFENGSVKTYESSTRILKSEKNKRYMESKYLPAWVAKKNDELQAKEAKSQKFVYYADVFLKRYKHKHDFQNVKYRVDRILNDFSNIDINKITRFHVEEWISSLENNNTQESFLSKGSQLKYLRVFRGVFELAVADNVLERNFTFDIKIEKTKSKLESIMPFETAEVKKLLEKSKNADYGEHLHNYLGIAFHQGMSPSEILGLQISDINIKEQTISIVRNITKGNMKETKNIYRERMIPIFDSSLVYLKSLILEAERKNTVWLFSNDDGTHLNDIRDIRGNKAIVKDGKLLKKISKWYYLLEESNIPYRDIKNCRHTFAVKAIESKAFTPQQVANMLGHSSLQMIHNHYAKWVLNKAIEADKSINLFS